MKSGSGVRERGPAVRPRSKKTLAPPRSPSYPLFAICGARAYHALGYFAGARRSVRPVFVVGTGRSGTTLLVKILDSHRDLVAYPSEANELWHPNAYPYDRRTIDAPPFLFDPAEFTTRSLASWTPGHERAIRRTLDGFMLARGRGRRLVLKSAMVSFMVERLTRVVPDALFVHIYRRGPSVVSSFVKKEWPKYGGMVDEAEMRLHCAHYWSSCLIELHRANEALGLSARGQWFECAYERLCAEPRRVLREMSDYAEIDLAAYAFDLSNIQSRNEKVGHVASDQAWKPSLEAMQAAAVLKGYEAAGDNSPSLNVARTT